MTLSMLKSALLTTPAGVARVLVRRDALADAVHHIEENDRLKAALSAANARLEELEPRADVGAVIDVLRGEWDHIEPATQVLDALKERLGLVETMRGSADSNYCRGCGEFECKCAENRRRRKALNADIRSRLLAAGGRGRAR